MNGTNEHRCARALIAVGAVLAVALAGCSTTAGPDSAKESLASAKCSLPVLQRVGLANDVDAWTDGQGVEYRKNGDFRVFGFVRAADDKWNGVPYVCEVTPDSTDKLRGFRVTSITFDENPTQRRTDTPTRLPDSRRD